MLCVAAQHPGAQSVEGAEPQAFGRLAQDGGNTLSHFPRRLVGEGDGEDLVGEGAPGQQDVGEPCRENAGFAGACPGQNQQRAVNSFHRSALFAVETGKVVDGLDQGTGHSPIIH